MHPEILKVVLIQLGSPKDPSISSVRHYLKEFLGDPRVVDINPLAWKIILNLFVLPFRPKRSAALYANIWKNNSFPLIEYTKDFSSKLRKEFEKTNIEIDYCFALSNPRPEEIFENWEKDRQAGKNVAQKVIFIPMFPQYSESTIGSVIDFIGNVFRKMVTIPRYEVIDHFHNSKAFIDGSIRQIEQYIQGATLEGKNIDHLIISFHGIPKRRVVIKKDPYYKHCFETFWLIKNKIVQLPQDKITMTFQSRFGSEEWLTPYTENKVIEIIKQGDKNIAVYCPSFVADCLETIDEIGRELNEEANHHGGNIFPIPCLNDDDLWAKDFAEYIKANISNKPIQDYNYFLTQEKANTMKEPKLEKIPLSNEAKSTFKIIFLTLFLDLVGFSIIFPLFPALAKYYLENDGENFFLNFIFNTITSFTSNGGAMNVNSIVLFGGALGAIYSFLQFIAAPIWGTISDRIGRRPVLIISVAGLALSYLLWFFSGSFTLLILARFIGGIMGGNISTATAVVADVTDNSNRSKGMAIIGISFALGFIIGPAMGGIFSLIDLTKHLPSFSHWGVNPFSMPALIAFLLSAFNVIYILKKFKETLPADKRGNSEAQRSINPIKLFAPLPYQGVNITNISYFLFLMAFSGMEFTLTFLAVERLSYTSMENAYMFIFIGVIIALVQGGFVRRKANDIGEKKVSIMGLFLLIPGLILIAFAHNSFLLYSGLFFLAIGSSMAIPCLTSLVSMYTPAIEQGKSIGIFRSLGALSRVFGPIIASLVYWNFGGHAPYIYGAIFLIIPILMLSRLPKVNSAA